MKKTPALLCSLLAALTSLSCSSAKGPAAGASPAAPAPTPTPSLISRVNPDVVEETETYTIQRFPKKDYIRVDDRHIRHPIVARKVEFFREDENYYYVHVPKFLPEEEAARRESQVPVPPPQATPLPVATAPALDFGMPPADFEDLSPRRVSGRLRLEEVPASGLPADGMWRASFVLEDLDRDGNVDVIAPPPRLGRSPGLHVYRGDGQGKFKRWPLMYTENGRPRPNFSLNYGGVAVGDIDGDGHLDVAAAGHAAGIIALFGDGKGGFEVARKGLPGRDFSSQAVVLLDINGDGRLDIVASSDTYDYTGPGWDPHQVRVYLSRGREWQQSDEALKDAAYSNSLQTFDYDRDGRLDVLTGSHAYGAVQLLWRNEENGNFSTGYFPQLEIHGYHFAMAPGTFGKDRLPAFADAFSRATNNPAPVQTEGITVYERRGAQWNRHRVWRKKEGKSFLFAVTMGDLDQDRLDDVLFADSEQGRLRVFFQEPDGSFREADQKEEPALDSPGQCARVADLNGDGRLDVVLARTVASGRAGDRGGFSVYLNRR